MSELRLDQNLEGIFETYKFHSKQTPPDTLRQLNQEVYADMYDSMLQNVLRVTKGNISDRDLRILRGAVVPAFKNAIEGKKDDLTGLPSKEMLTEITKRYMDLAEQIGGVVTFVYIDLDNFKEGVNEPHGHTAGDTFITTFGEVLKKVKRSYDVVGVTRNAQQVAPGKPAKGDEFGIVFFGSKGVPPDLLSEHIRTELMKHSGLLGFDAVRVSMGVATYQKGDKKINASKLIDNADTAMSHAKSITDQKVKYVQYSPDMARLKSTSR